MIAPPGATLSTLAVLVCVQVGHRLGDVTDPSGKLRGVVRSGTGSTVEAETLAVLTMMPGASSGVHHEGRR